MACVVVPAVEAAVGVAVEHIYKKKVATGAYKEKKENPFLKRIHSLNQLLGGGSILLAFEHIWHGEISPVFPFLTAVKSPSECSMMLHEMATVGVSMAVLVTAVWAIGVLTVEWFEKQRSKRLAKEGAQ